MKKVLFLAFAAAMTSVAVSSCSHSDYNGPTVVTPAQQVDTINNFILAHGLSNLTQDTAQLFQGYVMSEVLNPGNPNRKYADSIPVVYFKITGKLFDGQTFFTSADSSIRVNFLNTSDNTSVGVNLITSAVGHYLTTLGEGGSVTFVTPSYFGYANISGAISSNSITIPANSPLYYSQLSIDSIRSK